MSALPIIITTAGLNALVNAQNTGASNVVIASLGVSPTQIAATAATAAIPGEVKRIAGVAGQVVADDQIYISAGDQTEDTYTVRTIGLYLNTGVLFGVYSQAAPLLEKAAPAMAVLEAAIKLSAPQANVIEFTGGGWLNPQASETVQGVLKLAPVDEAVLGADHSKAVTPKGLKAATSAMMAAIQAAFDQIAQTLAGKANTVHQHAAGDVTSGVFSEARIPSLPQNRITGLIDALASKAAAVHGHTMSEIAGLAAALALKASLGASVGFGDVRVTRGGRVGVLYFGDGDDFILLSNGDLATNRPFNSPALTSAGYPVWHAGNFNPATKATLGAAVRFDRVSFGLANALAYADGDRLIFRAGAAGAERYFGCNADGSFEVYNGIIKSTNGPVWDPGNFTPATKATLGDTVTFADIRAFRANGTGVVYLGDLSHYVFFDGANYNMPGAPLIVNGGVVWTSATFNPNLKANMAAPSFTGTAYFGTEKRGQIWLMGGDDRPGVIEFRVDGVRYGFIGYGDGPNGNMYFGTDDNRTWIFTKRPSFNGATPWDAANLAFASGGEVVAGAEHAKMISPAGLFAFAKSLGNPAYAVIPGTGLMVQCGVMTGNFAEGQAHAALPVAFGGGCIAAVAVPQNPGSNLASNYFMQVVSKNLDRIVFYANRSDSSSGNINGFEWIAIGRVSGNPDPVYSSGGGGGGGGGGQVDPYA
ncbi:gp53-like domain-containing protein [Brevundimonas vesicularis]|uniref:Putative tail fiber protein gp53-like C-terminal domain-containing protein n=1 Tax=Brevundimonas vesicularis TaxID=41276 RepID=A0A1Z3U7V5_BREVE|nr:hypothetical protein [Brevundimonas vesicularis]ASE39341.1 hypothetical protein CEP68_07405 [Brevundimonas vesicularis]